MASASEGQLQCRKVQNLVHDESKQKSCSTSSTPTRCAHSPIAFAVPNEGKKHLFRIVEVRDVFSSADRPAVFCYVSGRTEERTLHYKDREQTLEGWLSRRGLGLEGRLQASEMINGKSLSLWYMLPDSGYLSTEFLKRSGWWICQCLALMSFDRNNRFAHWTNHIAVGFSSSQSSFQARTLGTI